jgi:hypothetical protein
MTDPVIQSVVNDFFHDKFGQKPQANADQFSNPDQFNKKPPGLEPQQQSTGGGGVGSSIGGAVGAAVGSFFGPVGTAVGGAVGGEAGSFVEQAVMGGAPAGPGGTITSGHVGSGGQPDIGDSLSRMATRGIQSFQSANGRGKVF